MDDKLKTLATVLLASDRLTFNFVEWSKSGQVPMDYHFSIPILGDAVDEQTLLSSTFETAEKEINWEFITDGVIFSPTVRDGKGVDRVDLLLSKDRKDINFDLDVQKTILDEDLIWKSLISYMKSRKIDDLMYVEANTTSVFIWRFQKTLTDKHEKEVSAEITKLDGDPDEIQVSNVKVDWEDIENKSKEEIWQRIKRFLTTSKADEEIKDTWANLMFNPKLHYESVLAQDILRADLTANLHSIKTSAVKTLSDFGAKPGVKSVLICSGDLAISMDEQHLLLALIDGLALYGNIQIRIDKRDLIASTALYSSDNPGEYCEAIDKLLGERCTLISAEPEGNGEQDEIVLRGKLDDGSTSTEVYGLRNRIQKIEIEEKAKLKLDPVKVANIGGIEEYMIHHNVVGKLIIDTRDHDEIRYGPDPRHNTSKIHAWLAGLR